jgi:hypothetical protein
MLQPIHWAQVVNVLPQERIVQENLSSIPGGNNYWLGLTYLPAELWITGGALP